MTAQGRVAILLKTSGGGQMAEEEDEDEEDEEDVYKNWRPPNKDTDFAA